MKRVWKNFFRLDEVHSTWIEPEELGGEKVIHHNKKRYRVKIPPAINKKITLRLKGLGKKLFRQKGDLYLKIWLNQGQDIWKDLWLSEQSAKHGVSQRLGLADRNIRVMIPRDSYRGLVIRLKGLGKGPNPRSKIPHAKRKTGNLMVKLLVYPDTITPIYDPHAVHTTDDLFSEGWVYRKFDEVILAIGKSEFPIHPVQADTIAEEFNLSGWRGVFQVLTEYLKLTKLNIQLQKSANLSAPGRCKKTIMTQGYQSTRLYCITIHEQFLNSPFSTAAILAHELCHVIFSEKIQHLANRETYNPQRNKASLEEERTVDLLVFMYKMGEFQLRVTRDSRLTIGYFNQKIFDRIQVIVAKKMSAA